MKDKSTKTLVTLILVVAVILGIGGIGVAYYYSTIGEVAPTTTFADQPYCSVYYKQDDEECSISDIPTSTYFRFFKSNCSDVADELSEGPPIYECRYNGTVSDSQCDDCTDQKFPESVKANNICQCCKPISYKELKMCKVGTVVRSCANVIVQDVSQREYDYGATGNILVSDLDPDLPAKISVAFDADLDYQELGIKINDQEVLKLTIDELTDCVSQGNATCAGSGDDIYVLNVNAEGKNTLDEVIGESSSLVVTGFANYSNSDGDIVQLDGQSCSRNYSLKAPEISSFGQAKYISDITASTLQITSIEIPVGNFVPDIAQDMTFKLETSAPEQDISPITITIPANSVLEKEKIVISQSDLNYPEVTVPDSWSNEAYSVRVSSSINYGEQTFNLGSKSFDLQQESRESLSCDFVSISPDKSDAKSVDIEEIELKTAGISQDSDVLFKIKIADKKEQLTEAFNIKADTKTVRLDLSDAAVNSNKLVAALDSDASQGSVNVGIKMVLDGEDYSCGSLPVLLGGATSAMSLDSTTDTTDDTTEDTGDKQGDGGDSGSLVNDTQASDYNLTVTTSGTGCFGRSASQSAGKFTITLTNHGSNSEKILSIVDKMPLGFQYNHGVSMTVNSSVTGDGSQNPEVDNVGNTQQLTWEKSGGWDLAPGGKIVINFKVIAGSQALTGTNRNEVFVTPADDPSDDSLRGDYTFDVMQSCISPDTGLFDDVASRIGVGLIAIIFGIIFYLVALEKNLKTDLSKNMLGSGILSVSERLRKVGLWFNSPDRFFKEDFEDRVSIVAEKLSQKKKKRKKRSANKKHSSKK